MNPEDAAEQTEILLSTSKWQAERLEEACIRFDVADTVEERQDAYDKLQELIGRRQNTTRELDRLAELLA